MRTWARAIVDLRCGLCNQTVEQGQPYQQLRSEGVRRVRIRCEDCADGLAPPDLPAAEPMQAQFTKKMQNLKDAIAKTDWKARAKAEASR